jgi:hypothetical protein
VADYDTVGGLRGYCRYDAERVAEISTGFVRPGAKSLLGEGLFIMTVDQGPDMDRYQGVTAIEGETLALCAEQYFAQSEQTPTRIRLAVGQIQTDGALSWRAGGMVLQNVAEDDAQREERKLPDAGGPALRCGSLSARGVTGVGRGHREALRAGCPWRCSKGCHRNGGAPEPAEITIRCLRSSRCHSGDMPCR